MFRAAALLISILALCAGAFLAIADLQSQATAARDAQSSVTELQLAIARAQFIPWGASPDDGGAVRSTRAELQDAEAGVAATLTRLERSGLPRGVRNAWERSDAALWKIFKASARGDEAATGEPSEVAAVQAAAAHDGLERAGRSFRADGVRALERARLGTAGVILLLFAAFAVSYWRTARARLRAERLADDKRLLLAASQAEALTDALTGLRNRRALTLDLAAMEPAAGEEIMLALFDLDGFKGYNDAFGHPAGDALLSRLGERLTATTEGIGRAYRMGGDEFCVLASVTRDGADSIARLAASALTESGAGFDVGCSFGVALLPSDTEDRATALGLADQRMYEQKSSRRASSGRESADVLRRLLAERNGGLGQHVDQVAELSVATARRLGLPDDAVERIRIAGELHDVGKAAVPDAILDKPGPLDPDEWTFIRRHSEIGERILLAAPSLTHIARTVRAVHERIDGGGYPDGLIGDAIPIGARIIAVCDAYDAMTTARPYRDGRCAEEAIAELRACAGTQFDRAVVEMFAAVLRTAHSS